MLDYRYEQLSAGELPIKLKDAKEYLKIDGSVDNSVIQNMIATVIQLGEMTVGRDFRVKTWKLFLDCFDERILIRKSQVASITSVEYTLNSVLTDVPNTVWQLKKGYQFSELVLRYNQVWPSDGDEIEHGIEIIFVTEVPRHIEVYKVAALKHLAFLYENRGDCSAEDAMMKSGAKDTYGSVIARV